MQKIGKFRLFNTGDFTLKLKLVEYSAGSQILVEGFGIQVSHGQSESALPGYYSIKNNSIVSLFTEVLRGTDCLAKEKFMYKKDSDVVANYEISGTPDNYRLTFKNCTVDKPQLPKCSSYSTLPEIIHSPMVQYGRWGVLEWNIKMFQDIYNPKSTHAKVCIQLARKASSINRLDYKEQKKEISLSTRDLRLNAELFIDLNQHIIQLKGTIENSNSGQQLNLRLLSYEDIKNKWIFN